ncbi:MAG: DUF1576 domain-containing protein [Oscillospiraceae bacterium]|nr:DUF1576 domain-containing protein [Oscillospiraceae bacterium]MBQ9148210.1 DUF1576 domain-containing protein [Oscillospiraceae bacterium]
MKKIRDMQESSFLKLFFTFIIACFLIGAVCMPDRGAMFSGLWKILSNPGKITTNYFELGGYAATFLNMGLVGLCCLLIFLVTGATVNNVSTFAFILTIGFASWGMNIINIWPTVLGVVVYCLVKKEKFSANANAMIFSTGIAPLISDLLVRYPNAEVVGFNLPGLVVTLIVGLFIGFLVPAGLGHAPKVHKGFDLYSAAVPVCLIAFFLNATLYKTMGVELPAAPGAETLQVASQATVNIFCLVVFGLCLIFGLALGGKPKEYWQMMTAPDHVSSVTANCGKAVFLMNVGIFGLFILAYYNAIGASFNGVTFGIIFCMLCTCNSGSHPGNVWPIMAGYVIGSFLFGWLSSLAGGAFAMTINAQAIAIGLCFANGLSPVASRYGWFWGIVAGLAHYVLVTSVPNMHGGFCVYNGGFTAAVICVLMIPVLEKFCKTKAEKLAQK